MLSVKQVSTVILAFVLVVAFVAPVLATDYNLGVKVGDYVHYYFLGVNIVHLAEWEKIEVVAVSGKEVTLYTTGQYKDVPFPSGTTFFNVETGATNYTHSEVGQIIAANLNEGDVIPELGGNFVINKTELREYMNVSRQVNIVEFYEQNNITRLTYVFDKISGIMLENENMFYDSTGKMDKELYQGVDDTNIFKAEAQTGFSLPAEYLYAIITVVAVAAPATAVVFVRKRKQPKKTSIVEEKEMDLTYNLSGVKRGECYLSDSLERCVKIVSDLQARGVSGLCIVREDPEVIVKTYNLKPEDVVLLSSKQVKGFQAVDGLQDIAILVMKFLKSGGGVVLLDGLEYLISRFGFNTVYMCLQEKHIEFLEAGAVLLVPVNMETLDAREKGQLLSELKLL
jgi:hypothetical protein